MFSDIVSPIHVNDFLFFPPTRNQFRTYLLHLIYCCRSWQLILIKVYGILSYWGLGPSHVIFVSLSVDECFKSLRVSQVRRGGKPVGFQVRLPRVILILSRTSSLSNDCSLFKVDECFQSFHVSQVGRGGKPVGIQVRLPRSIFILSRTSSLSIYLVSLSKWTSASKAFKSLRWGMEVSLRKPGSAATPYFILSRISSLT